MSAVLDVLDVLGWIFAGVCAVIPDPLEAWLAGGGNAGVIVLLLLALGAWQLIKPSREVSRG